MKIEFAYDDVQADDLKSIIDYFYQEYKDVKGTDGEPLLFGKINLYITLRNRTDNVGIGVLTKNKEPLAWLIKNRTLKGTKRPVLAEFEYDNGEKLVIYEDVDKKNTYWG